MARKKAARRRRPRGRNAKPVRRSKTAKPRRASKARASTPAKRRKKKAPRPGAPPARRDILGPPPREATIIRSDREREAAARLAQHHATSPKLSGGDVDADWERAASVGEEAVGGTVATPDQSVVDDLGAALGVPRAPDEALRTSSEILDARDRRRHRQEG
ncbi:MAG TPA: DUF6335 family protein [Methylomirabilota bacterium]|jgi:hypothetical protein|nr:DUF6335 family protein [Methylomirabilota bacterium]